MAEWVQKGNLKGPQGDPGQDAQLPAGGTEGQVLTKTSGGEAWADVPQPDMTGVVKVGTGQGSAPYLTTGGVAVPAVGLTDTIPDSGEPEAYALVSATNILATGSGGQFNYQAIGDGSVTTIIGSNSSTLNVVSSTSNVAITASASSGGNAGIGVSSGSGHLIIDSKSVTSITDAISDSPTGNALVTDKAVAGYVKALVATDEEFDSVFGL